MIILPRTYATVPQYAGKKSELANSKYILLKNAIPNKYKKPTNPLELSWLLLYNSKFLLILTTFFNQSLYSILLF